MMNVEKVEIISSGDKTQIKLNDGTPLENVTAVKFERASADMPAELTLSITIG